MTKRPPSDEELRRRADEVLHYIWDPIGVAGIPAARDEYDAYLSRVCALLEADANAERIASYLTEVTTERMGLGADSQHALHVANLLLEWKRTLAGRKT